MSYVKSKKSFEVRGGIFLLFCRVQKNTWQIYYFAAAGERGLCLNLASFVKIYEMHDQI